ncbi:MAG TPA: 30S ribosomal protein S6 [candidate division Zixibacteria bacterium]|jgi:small subunit ribosomal protein S6
MRDYETTLILDPQLAEEGWEQAITKYSTIISAKGTIKRTDRWGLRRLAYTIRKHGQGYYVHFIHYSSTDVPREIERQCELDEQCLRYLTVASDNPKYVEEMDKRASGEGTSVSEEGDRSASRETTGRPVRSGADDAGDEA